MTRIDISVLLTTLLLSIWLWYLYELYQVWGWKPSPKKFLRQLRFRTPHDCPYCGGKHLGRCERVVASKPLPLAWSQVKSKRGRKKQIKTDGHACPNTECACYGIRNQQIHTLIGYGHHGKCMRCLHRPHPEPFLPGMRNQGHKAVGNTDVSPQDG